jgi:hypothetical protein
MIRQVFVSTAVLCGLFAAGDAAAKSPNMPNLTKFAAPRAPATSRLLAVPRRIAGPDLSLATDADDTAKTKKKKKKIVARDLKGSKHVSTSKKDIAVSDRLRDAVVVFGGNASALADLKEILEGLQDGDNGAFGGPLATLFSGQESVNPKPEIPGTGGHTTGQHEGTDNPGHSLDDILAGFADAGSGGDNRGPDEGQSESDEPEKTFGGDRTGSVGGMGIGAFGGGVADPSGQASQDRRGGWASCGHGCTFRLTEIRRGGRVVANREDRRTQAGRTTSTTDTEGTTVTRFRSRHWAYESYTSVSHTRDDGRQKIEVRDYDNPDMDDVIITYVVGADGGWTEGQTTPIPEVEQPAPDDTPVGGGPRGGAFYRVVCGGMVCTYTALSRQEVAVNFGPIQINPGHVEGAGSVDSGPRVGPRALTDPDPENLGVGSGSRRPVRRGCGGGLVRC